EALTGYDFLSALPDEIEIPLEAKDNPPVASLGAAASASEGSAVQFDASASTDPDAGDAVQSFEFDFGDGSPILRSANATPTHTFADNGNYTVTLTVYDKGGAFSHATQTVPITNLPPSATFAPPASSPEGSPFTLSMTAATDPSLVDATALLFAFDCGDGSYAPATSSPSMS